LWINSIYPIQDGSVFIATQNGLVKYKNGIWQQLLFSKKNFPYEQIHELAVEENGKLWLASGLNDGQEVGFKVYPDSLIFMDDDNFKTKDIGSFYWWITDIFIDRNNTKWIGTSGGLFKVTDDTVQSYYSWNSGIPSYYILSISEDAFGNLWIGTIDGLAKLKNDVWTVYDTLNSGLPNNAVYEVFVDRYQNVWCGTEQGLAKFNGLTWTVYSLSNSPIGENFIHHFAIDKVNHIWLCNSKGLHHFNGTKWETFDELNSKLPTNFINDIKVDSRNNKWLGLFYGGLVLIDSAGKWSLFNQDNSPLLKNNVTSLFIDNNDNKWIGTFAGLNVYNENGINTNYVKKPKDEPYYYNLSQNYPNPFNHSSTINYTVESESRVSIKVYDVLGREVSTLVDEVKSYGKYSVQFNASDLPSGVYIYQLQVGNYFITKKAILLK
jgi:ligand-binding sensor domain-containing protein